MYSMEEQDYGLRITFRDKMEADDMRNAIRGIRARIDQADVPFSIVSDRRGVRDVAAEVESSFAVNENAYKSPMLHRLAALINSDRLDYKFDLDRVDAQVADKVRYFDEATNPDAEEEAIRWAREGLPPAE